MGALGRYPLERRSIPACRGLVNEHGVEIGRLRPEIRRNALRGPLVEIAEILDFRILPDEMRQLMDDGVGTLLDAQKHETEGEVDRVEPHHGHLACNIVFRPGGLAEEEEPTSP